MSEFLGVVFRFQPAVATHPEDLGPVCVCCGHPMDAACVRCAGVACADCDFCHGCARLVCDRCNRGATGAFMYPGDRHQHPHACPCPIFVSASQHHECLEAVRP